MRLEVCAVACVFGSFVAGCVAVDGEVTPASVNATKHTPLELHTISGTIDAGAAAGQRIYINLVEARDERMTSWGTSIETGGEFAIQGVPTGRYRVVAYADDLGFGRRRAHSLAAESNVIDLDSDTEGITLQLEQLAEMVIHPPHRLSAHPVDGGAALYWHGSSAGALEAADSYNVYWSRSPQLSTTNYEGVRRNIGGQGLCSNMWHRDLENGERYYWLVTAQSGDQESEASPVTGPVTIGTLSGGGTLSGTVHFEGGAPGAPAWVVVVTNDAFESFYTYIEDPSEEQPFVITGLPERGGELELLDIKVVVDADNDGAPSFGDYNVEAPVQFPANGSNHIVQDMVVGAAFATTRVRTNYWEGAGIEGGAVDVTVVQARKLPTRVVLTGLDGSVDLGGLEREDINGRAFVYLGAPEPGFEVDVTYADFTEEHLSLDTPESRPNFPSVRTADAHSVSWDSGGEPTRVLVYREGHAFVPFSTQEYLGTSGGVVLTEWTTDNSVVFDQPLVPGRYVLAVECRDSADNRSTTLLPFDI